MPKMKKSWVSLWRESTESTLEAYVDFPENLQYPDDLRFIDEFCQKEFSGWELITWEMDDYFIPEIESILDE